MNEGGCFVQVVCLLFDCGLDFGHITQNAMLQDGGSFSQLLNLHDPGGGRQRVQNGFLVVVVVVVVLVIVLVLVVLVLVLVIVLVIVLVLVIVIVLVLVLVVVLVIGLVVVG